MTKAQEVYERTEALVASGVSKADAFKQLADEYKQPLGSIRGAYYAHTSTLGGTPRSPRKRKTTVDPVAEALSALEEGLESFDDEVAAAKQRAEDAKAEYEHLRDTAKERKVDLQRKIDALKS
jgi:nitrogen-specific signal transduction histidine kinase